MPSQANPTKRDVSPKTDREGLRIPLPTGRVPRVIGVDDFALRRRHRYAAVVIDAETHERIDVLPDRTADTLEAWLRKHPGVEIVCRDGSATYAEAIRRALPDAVQVGDRWHLWHNLCEAVLSETKALGFTGCLNLLHKYINQGRAPRPPGPTHRRLPRVDPTGNLHQDLRSTSEASARKR